MRVAVDCRNGEGVQVHHEFEGDPAELRARYDEAVTGVDGLVAIELHLTNLTDPGWTDLAVFYGHPGANPAPA